MKVQLLTKTTEPEYAAAYAAAICTDNDDPFASLRGAMRSGHESVVEHASFTFLIEGVSRACLQQIVRCRLASYSVESQRYVNQSEKSVVVPPSIADNPKALTYYNELVAGMKTAYDYFIDHFQIPKEDARYILPEGMETRLIMTMNVRELRHFFSLRLCNRAQWEIRNMAEEMYRLCKAAAPRLFENCGCGCMTRTGCQESRPCGHSRKEDDLNGSAGK